MNIILKIINFIWKLFVNIIVYLLRDNLEFTLSNLAIAIPPIILYKNHPILAILSVIIMFLIVIDIITEHFRYQIGKNLKYTIVPLAIIIPPIILHKHHPILLVLSFFLMMLYIIKIFEYLPYSE